MAEKLWFKIGEAAGEVGVLPSEIRYWEKKVPEIRPRRSKGNLRYYHRDDLPKLLAIRRWIEAGFSVTDCRELLRKEGAPHGPGAEDTGGPAGPGGPGGPGDGRPGPAQQPKGREDAEERERAAPPGEGQREAKPLPEPPPLPWLESIIDEMKALLGRLERPLP